MSTKVQGGAWLQPGFARWPQGPLHFERAMPVLNMGSQPFVVFDAVGSDEVELSATASRPAELELDDTAGRDKPGLDERA